MKWGSPVTILWSMMSIRPIKESTRQTPCRIQWLRTMAGCGIVGLMGLAQGAKLKTAADIAITYYRNKDPKIQYKSESNWLAYRYCHNRNMPWKQVTWRSRKVKEVMQSFMQLNLLPICCLDSIAMQGPLMSTTMYGAQQRAAESMLLLG